jgi:hypothetical protein
MWHSRTKHHSIPMDPVYRTARKRVKRKARFFRHLQAFVLVNTFISVMTFFDGEPFANFPMVLMWGIGLAFHYTKVFGLPGTDILSSDWEEREIEKEMDRMQDRGYMNERPPQLPSPTPPLPQKEKITTPKKERSYRDRDLV